MFNLGLAHARIKLQYPHLTQENTPFALSHTGSRLLASLPRRPVGSEIDRSFADAVIQLRQLELPE